MYTYQLLHKKLASQTKFFFKLFLFIMNKSVITFLKIRLICDKYKRYNFYTTITNATFENSLYIIYKKI